jgi:hypothetical protein
MFHRVLNCTLVIVIALGLAPTARAAIVLTATLTGSQEVPPNASNATGFAIFELNDAQTAMTMDVTVNGIDFTGLQTPLNPNDNLTNAHIHAPASPGANAGVRWGFIGMPFNDTVISNVVVTPFATGVGGRVTGVWDQLEGNSTTLTAQLPSILAGLSYINFHTVAFGGGEIRGQILPTPVPASWAIWGLGAVGVGFMVRRRKCAS